MIIRMYPTDGLKRTANKIALGCWLIAPSGALSDT